MIIDNSGSVWECNSCNSPTVWGEIQVSSDYNRSR